MLDTGCWIKQLQNVNCRMRNTNNDKARNSNIEIRNKQE
jgi:hypothetical protein